MTRNTIRVLLVCAAAIIVTGIMVNGVYACFIRNTGGHHNRVGQPMRVDLKLCDQDESWGDGVWETWTAGNMAPGEEFAFDGHFVEITGDVPGIKISCDYVIYGESSTK